MRAGQLRHRIKIQEQARTSDGAGGSTIAWNTIATISARVLPLAGQELFEAQKQNPKVSHRVEARYRAGVTAKNRILFDSRILNIEAVANLEERGREMHLMCEELAS